MELRIHRPGGICLPLPTPKQYGRALVDACHRTGSRLADAVRRHAAARIGLYSAAGTASTAVAVAVGMEPADAVSMGINVAATAAAFWPTTAKTATREAC
ncbi:hypothetical protein QMZ92_35165 [Streptomyces sp. HNM0645]|uniref:hypothetical protein n=1 Tax=Streptomyces sp. HNM0645 TaxID=2782343 RepID=UPI0024B847DD|nr:hypothetical protein [Streptomyces sp. HNM0645]MDI9889411.1 hypothetical protein [Streptomyces sp. HNM0645]